MTESELIKNIKGLKQIKPNQEWVFLTKQRIAGNEAKTPNMAYRFADYFRFLNYKPALVIVACFGLLISTFVMSKNALPGDMLFPVKRIVEKSQEFFIPKDKLADYQLEQTSKRLNELVTIAQGNQINKISSAVNELKEVTKNLKSTGDNEGSQKVLADKEKVVKALGTMIADNEELNSAVKALVDREINDLEARTLTDEQANLLNSAKQSFAEGDYIRALESIWLISNQNTEIQ